ncbi:INCE protein, partial [Dromaius novaehollandiae]|nr:INCE protein [Dromaius novaehollandiae]
ERERQRLESLRKKQEAEEQRKKKVEEEKRRRQAEMKQKREERLRKALQARERVEQMEEEKKKRMEQKILQNDEKVRMREEKAVEERSKKKLSKKAGEADARKQTALKMVRATQRFSFFQEEDEFVQQELLQKRREDEVKEKGKKVLELRNLVEQRQGEQVKERYDLPNPLFQGRFRLTGMETSLHEPQQQAGEEKKTKQPESVTAASSTWLSKTVKVSLGSSRTSIKRGLWCLTGFCALVLACRCLLTGSDGGKEQEIKCWPPKGPKGSRSPKVSENNYGMDLNSDDSTDDENEPRKPVPAWADGSQLNQAILHQYYHPVNVDQLFGLIASPRLEDIFGKNKPRYFKRTSSAVWHSPP